MGSNHVPERRTLVRNVVPREGKSPILWSVFQKQIRYHPRTVLEFGEMRRSVFAIRANQIAAEKVRRGEYNLTSVNPRGAPALVINRNHINTVYAVRNSRNDLRGCQSQSDLRLRLFVEVRDQAAVAFGPGHQRSRFGA